MLGTFLRLFYGAVKINRTPGHLTDLSGNELGGSEPITAISSAILSAGKGMPVMIQARSNPVKLGYGDDEAKGNSR